MARIRKNFDLPQDVSEKLEKLSTALSVGKPRNEWISMNSIVIDGLELYFVEAIKLFSLPPDFFEKK